MRKLKLRYLWIIILVLVACAFAIVYGCTVAQGGLNTFLIVLLAIDFIALTILVQIAGSKTFKYKPKKINYPTMNVKTDPNTIKGNLKRLKYKERVTPFGNSYLAIINTTAVKVTIIENDDLYFNPTEEDTKKPNHSLDSCDRFVGFEIFLNPKEENKDKLVDFSIQGKNVYYTAFMYDKEDNLFKCLNYIIPQDDFQEGFNKLYNDLGFVKIEDTEEGN